MGYAHFNRSSSERPITQSLSLSDRKVSSSVKCVMRWPDDCGGAPLFRDGVTDVHVVDDQIQPWVALRNGAKLVELAPQPATAITACRVAPILAT